MEIRRLRGYRFKPALSIALAVVVAVGATAAPQAELWPRWTEHDPTSTVSLDHGLWQEFLDSYLVTDHSSGVNRVRYADVRDGDRRSLQRYIDQMSAVPVSTLSREEQLPYWINVYNAVTIELILTHYPVDSIRDIDDPWDTPLVTVEDVDLTLNDIEHRIIRPIWQDNRIHYLVNCASYGCPDLRPTALSALNYDDEANAAATAYISHERGVDVDGNRATLSSIYKWYQEDFGDSEDGVVQHVSRFGQQQLANQLSDVRRVRYNYDWSLNEP
jgi:hypothetical protein